MSTDSVPSHTRDLYASCVDRVHKRHGKHVRDLVGKTIFDALVSEQLFYVVAGQDESIAPESVVRVLRDLHTCHAEATS